MMFEPPFPLAATDLYRGSKPNKESVMKSLIARTVLIASLALTANAAMAATTPAHRYATRAHAAARIAPRLADGQQADIGQFIQSMFGGGWPVQYSGLMQDAMRARPARRSQGSSDYDSSPAIDTSSSGTDAQAASDAESQAIQSMNDSNALNASTAAAEAANDAANAATLQTEINAGF
jgi:hypothetical protein